MKDEEISKKLQQKDSDIFDYIMEHYNKLLWVVVGNILENVSSSEDIEDCISDVYIKLLENPKIYDYKKGSLKSFIVRVAKNRAIDKYRKLSRGNVKMFREYSDVYDEEDPLQSMITKESREKILEVVDSLKEPDREIIIRRYFYNEKVEVISEKMSLPSKKIENTLYQGKLRLKTILIKKEGF
ncbi:sigma-70 family RNA polymerase sigma factor [Tissierella praeacuta]|uniref:sigma-70 family RNA polymerase sigma factor n=1 Tax=Tissierella praeacuta TaxID=43131 RepID=UPI001C10DDFA|nr:sigma-70 family RNA polymerase sigma factor [Tissierella praeacuta]MBU5255830.1 sigma-70 family RNA polymerase sigma factor [Tissierella praeacuta]